uniref:ferrochelatase n=1 Tax=Nocardia brasiliensis TaxID=37326 RepID=UPI00245514AA
MARAADALLLLSFGGPERPEDVMPFLENVTRGRGVRRAPRAHGAQDNQQKSAGWADNPHKPDNKDARE